MLIAVVMMQAVIATAPEDVVVPTAIAAARQVVDGPARGLWPGWDQAPFGVLVIGPETETLYCHQGPAEGFSPGAVDPVTGCATHQRPRSLPANLRAAFPAVDGVSTIVIGTPEGTGLTTPTGRPRSCTSISINGRRPGTATMRGSRRWTCAATTRPACGC